MDQDRSKAGPVWQLQPTLSSAAEPGWPFLISIPGRYRSWGNWTIMAAVQRFLPQRLGGRKREERKKKNERDDHCSPRPVLTRKEEWLPYPTLLALILHDT